MDSSSQKSRKGKDVSTKHLLLKTRKKYFSVIHSLASSLFCPFPSDETLCWFQQWNLLFEENLAIVGRGDFIPQISSEVCVLL